MLLASYYCQVVHLYRCVSRAHPRGERGGGARACLGEREGEGEKGVIWGIRYSRALFFPRARAPTRSQKEWMGARESQENQGGGGESRQLAVFSYSFSPRQEKESSKKKGEEEKKSSGSGGGGCPPARAARAARRDGQQKQQKQHTHTQGGRIFHSSSFVVEKKGGKSGKWGGDRSFGIGDGKGEEDDQSSCVFLTLKQDHFGGG